MTWLPLFALVAVPRGCSPPSTQEPPGEQLASPDLPRELPPSWELGLWTLPSNAQRDAYDAQGRHVRVVEWVDHDCMDTAGCGTMQMYCGGLDLEITEGELRDVVRLARFWGVRGSAPLWVDADHVLVVTDGAGQDGLVKVERQGDSWYAPAPLFELEHAWMEPLAVVGREVLVRVTAARFRWENEGVVTAWLATSPEELRELGAGATREWAEWTGESLHRLYWLDLEQRQLRPAGISAWWYAAQAR
jgi:hypothetical protein